MARKARRNPTSEPKFQAYGRLHRYGRVGVLLIFLLLASLVLGAAGIYYGVQGPGLLTVTEAIWILGLLVGLVTIGMLYLLFTLRSEFRLVREQATGVAIDRSQAHQHRFFIPSEPPARRVSRPVDVIQGIGPKMGQRLSRNGIRTLEGLRHASNAEIAAAAQTSEGIAASWKSMAHLMEVPGIDDQAAEVLSRAGILTPEDLSDERPKNLLARVKSHAKLYPGKLNRDTVSVWIDSGRRYVEGTPMHPRMERRATLSRRGQRRTGRATL